MIQLSTFRTKADLCSLRVHFENVTILRRSELQLIDDERKQLSVRQEGKKVTQSFFLPHLCAHVCPVFVLVLVCIHRIVLAPSVSVIWIQCFC